MNRDSQARRRDRRRDEPIPFDPDGRASSGELMRTARKFLLLASIGFGLVVLWLLRDLLILVFLAALIASALYEPTHLLERRLPRIAALAVTYLAVLVAVALLLVFILPPLATEIARLFDELPRLVEEARSRVVSTVNAVAGDGAGERLLESLTSGTEAPPAELLRVPLTMLQVLANLALIVFLSALFLLERDNIARWSMRFLLARDREPTLELINKALGKLGAYVRGQLVVMVITGIGTATGMFILGVPYAVPMGLLGFLAEAIPLAGPILAGVPVLALALLESPFTAAAMLVWLVALQQLEGWFIYPVVQGRILSLSPVVVVLGVLAGATLYGVIGAIVAVPLIAVIDVAVREIVFPLRRRASRRDQETAA